jgi:hypothetical protein
MLAVAAALIAPRFAVPAQSHVPGAALPDCRAVLALPGELHRLVGRGADAPCGLAIIVMPTPLALADVSAQGMAQIWARPAPAPNERIAQAQHVIRATYAAVMDGLHALAQPAPGAPASQAALP